MKQFLLRLTVIFGIMFVLVGVNSVSSTEQNGLQARWIQAEINRWRLGLELGPLAYNPTLEAMAIAQAEYVLSLPQWPSNIHAGRSGEGPRVRARWEPYNWQTYGDSEQIIIGEIAWLGTREDAIAFWHSSTVHRNTVINPWYREIGISAIPAGRGFMFVAVLGARPNVLPAIADPYTDSLYLTDEAYTRGIGNSWIRHVAQIQLFDSAGRPISNEWMSWQAKITLPDNMGDSLYVLYSDGEHEVMDAVSLLESDAPLPEYADVWVPDATATPAVILPTVTPTALPIPHIRIVYNSRSLTLYNTAPALANLADLQLVSDAGIQMLNTLNTAHTQGTLRSLPMLNCLHITQLGRRAGDPPAECRYASTTTLLPNQLFWTTADFQVWRNGTLIAECRQADERCEFDLPS